MPLESEDVYACCYELAAQSLLTVTMKSSDARVLPPPLDMAPFSLDMAPKLPKLKREGNILPFRFISFQGAACSLLM